MTLRRVGETEGPGGEKFSRTFRLREEKAFRNLLSAGEKISTAFFFIRHRINDSEHPRLGIVVPKKNFRRAVDRNRLKRLTRESFRRVAGQLPAHDFLVYYLASALRAERVVLSRSLRESWSRISK